jgi:hypothetical protein
MNRPDPACRFAIGARVRCINTLDYGELGQIVEHHGNNGQVSYVVELAHGRRVFLTAEDLEGLGWTPKNG